MKKKRNFATMAVLLVLGAGSAYAQVGMPTNNPQKNAQLDLNANNNTNTKGLLLPRVSLVATNNVAPLIGTVLSGMKVYNIATAGSGNTAVTPGEYFYDGLKWVRVATEGGTASGEPWYDVATQTGATANTQDIYQMGKIGIGKNNPQAQLDVSKDALINGVTIGLGGGQVDDNTAVGYNSLRLNTTGNQNSALGANALASNTTGKKNTAIGIRALQENRTSDYNTGLGSDALAANNGGSWNTAVGTGALANNLTGSYNSSMGVNSLVNNTTGSYNSAIGISALTLNNTGHDNVAMGVNTLESNTTGLFNVAFGNGALQKNTIAIGSTAIGHQALVNSTGDLNTAVGYQALLSTTTGSRNVALGDIALHANTTGSNNLALGNSAGQRLTTGNNNILIGNNCDVPNNTGNNQIRIGNTFMEYAGIQIPWTVTSDARLKTNVKNNPLGLDFVKQLKPVVYNRFTDDGNGVNSKNEYGFIAQEIMATLEKNGVNLDKTGMISYDENADRYSVRYNDLISILTKAVQEQQTEIETLKKEQQSQIDALKKEMLMLKSK